MILLNLKLLLTTVCLSFVILSCSGEQTENSKQTESVSLEMAPDFEVTTIDGEAISLVSSLENNKPVVIYFTASWCPTCAKNWPVLSEVYPEFEDELTLVAISIDPTDTEDVIRKLSDEKGFKFPSTAGNPDIMVDFGVSSQATTVGVNRNGEIAFMKSSQALSAEEFRELFTGLVN